MIASFVVLMGEKAIALQAMALFDLTPHLLFGDVVDRALCLRIISTPQTVPLLIPLLPNL